MNILRLIIVILAAVAVVVGSSVYWNAVNDSPQALTTEEERSALRLNVVATWIAIACVVLSVFTDKLYDFGAVILLGVMFVVAIAGPSLNNGGDVLGIDYYQLAATRRAIKDDSNIDDWVKKAFGGAILIHLGLVVALLSFLRKGADVSWRGVIVSLIAIGVAVVSGIVCWTAETTASFEAFQWIGPIIAIFASVSALFAAFCQSRGFAVIATVFATSAFYSIYLLFFFKSLGGPDGDQIVGGYVLSAVACLLAAFGALPILNDDAAEFGAESS